MDWSSILDNKIAIAILSAVAGAISTGVTSRLLGRRALFTYYVNHATVGISADDAAFGSVRVTWNNQPLPNLYISTVELTNESNVDFENVAVTAYAGETLLYTERPEAVGSTQVIEWDKKFAQVLNVPTNSVPTQQQLDIYGGRRQYVVPVMNRGQIVRLTYLSQSRTANPPRIWLDVPHKGIRLQFRIAHAQTIMGAPTQLSSNVGIVLAACATVLLVAIVNSVPVVGIVALLLGLSAQIPGAIAVRAWRSVSNWYRG